MFVRILDQKYDTYRYWKRYEVLRLIEFSNTTLTSEAGARAHAAGPTENGFGSARLIYCVENQCCVSDPHLQYFYADPEPGQNFSLLVS